MPCPSMGPNHFGPVKIILYIILLFEPAQNDLDLSKTNWTQTKQFGPMEGQGNVPFMWRNDELSWLCTNIFKCYQIHES